MEYIKLLLVTLLYLNLLSYLPIGFSRVNFEKTISDDYNENFQSDTEYFETEYAEQDVIRPGYTNRTIQHQVKLTPYFTTGKYNITIKENETVVLYCDVRDLREDNILMWHNGSKMITQSKYVIAGNSSRVRILGNNAIGISNTQVYDSNTYRCVVIPEKIHLDVDLKVEGSPKVIIYSYGRDVTQRSITHKQGTKVEFECKAVNMGNYTIKWFFKGNRSESGITRNGKVIFDQIDSDNAGLYQCLGDDGSSNPPNGTVTVNVQYVPEVILHRHYVNTIHSDNAEVSCEYKANPIAISNWKKDNKLLPRASNKYLIHDTIQNAINKTLLSIKNVVDSDLGAYECVLKNSIGETKRIVHLIFEPEPGHFDRMHHVNNSVVLSWSIRSKQALLEVVIEYRINSSETWITESVVHLEKLNERNDLYIAQHKLQLQAGDWHARIKSRNTAGWSRHSRQHNFKVKEKIETQNATSDIIRTAGIGNNSKSCYLCTHITTTVFASGLFTTIWSIVYNFN